ncbi:hypothetical protein NQ317_019927 [Molorchus minor]|uniref:hydroxyisourate hydrolase n=1 Tax=Molorchus minor TaxID=1323400 RepID=A0ABQ9K5X6_9CUCU|nr:hypothetical protein NQ317_019927 [Molorchus minor]
MESEEIEQVDEGSHDSEINVIPVQLVETYEAVSLQSPSNSSNITRGKYYKQTYRPAWEHMTDFKGKFFKLVGFGGRRRAYQGLLYLLPEDLTCPSLEFIEAYLYYPTSESSSTTQHEKGICFVLNIPQNSLKYFQVENKAQGSGQVMEPQTVIINEGIVSNEEIDEDGDTQTIEYVDTADVEDGDTEHENEEDEEEDRTEVDFHSRQIQKTYVQQQPQTDVPPISTHVMDTTRGQPVTGLQVSLYKLIDGRWTYINEGVTNNSGKFSSFLDRSDFTPGRYKLHYDVDRYFEARKQDTLYPFIEIVFDSTLYTENYHIPMLLSPYGYTTYRGS